MFSSLTRSLFNSSSNKKEDNLDERSSNLSVEDFEMSQDMDTDCEGDAFHEGCDDANDEIDRLRRNSVKSLRPESLRLLRVEASQFFKDKSASTSNFVDNAKEWGLGLNRSLSFDRSRDANSDQASDSQTPTNEKSSSSSFFGPGPGIERNLSFDRSRPPSFDGRSRPPSFDLAKSFLSANPPDFMSKKRSQHPTEDVPAKSSMTPWKRFGKENAINESEPPTSPTFIKQSRMQADFHIIDVIGSGTFGSVYRAKRKLDNAVYAVKQSRQQAHSNQDRNDMLREVQSLALLQNENMEDLTNIVRYYSSWCEDDYLYIQMEVCEASVDLVYFDTDNISTLLRDMLNAFRVIHRLEIAHLDVKPGNILLKNNHYKLCDFGMSLKTVNGIYKGDIEEGDTRYMAQELLEWSCTSDLRKCDIFSLGVTGYELLCGKRVEAEGSQWLDLRNGVFEFPENAPEEICGLLAAMMGVKPAQRPTAEKCIEECSFLKTDLEREVEFLKRSIADLEEKSDPHYHR